MAKNQTQDVKGCARCGGEHVAVTFKPMQKAMAPADAPVSWTHWAPCPTNGEPIMLSISPVERHDAPVRQNVG